MDSKGWGFQSVRCCHEVSQWAFCNFLNAFVHMKLVWMSELVHNLFPSVWTVGFLFLYVTFTMLQLFTSHTHCILRSEDKPNIKNARQSRLFTMFTKFPCFWIFILRNVTSSRFFWLCCFSLTTAVVVVQKWKVMARKQTTSRTRVVPVHWLLPSCLISVYWQAWRHILL